MQTDMQSEKQKVPNRHATDLQITRFFLLSFDI